MRRGNLFVIILVFILILALGGSAFAAPGSVMYRKYYDIDGIILMKIQTGSEYSESGYHKTLIDGVGSLQRDELITMSMAGINIFNDSSWFADPGSLRGLGVASAFNLNALRNEQGEFNGEGKPAPDSHQVFAVSVKANPGEAGRVSQNIAAVAPLNPDESGVFAIDQYAAVSDGTVKRFIDLIEPVSGLYIFEDSTIKGKAEIYDSLQPSGDEEVTGIEAQMDSKAPGSGISGFAGEDPETADQSVIILENDEYFRTAVSKGTPVEAVGLPETIELSYGLTTITGITVQWDEQDFENYDPETAGSYLFFGKLIFPESVSIYEELYLCFIVEVIDAVTVNDQASDHLEDPVHGGKY